MAPCSLQALAPSSSHANIGAVSPTRGLSCWRLAPRKPLLLRRTTPTEAPLPRRAAFPCWRLAPRKPLRLRQATPTEAPFPRRAGFHVGALLPASPCFFVGPRQQRRRYPGMRPFLLAPCSPQALSPSSGHANRGAVPLARGLFGSRLPAGKANKLGLHFFLGDGFFARGIDRNLIRVKK